MGPAQDARDTVWAPDSLGVDDSADTTVVSITQARDAATGVARILVISINVLIAEALLSALVQRGFEPRSLVPSSGDQLSELLEWSPDVALVEIDPARKGLGIELIGRLRAMSIPVAVMSGDSDPRLFDECLSAGAAAVVDTRSPLTELVATFSRLADGTGSARPEITRHLRAPETPWVPPDPHRATKLRSFAVLTTKERYVLSRLMNGDRAESIARTSSVSISTVRSQIKAILQKLGVNSQLGAVAMAREAGWDDDSVPTATLQLG